MPTYLVNKGKKVDLERLTNDELMELIHNIPSDSEDDLESDDEDEIEPPGIQPTPVTDAMLENYFEQRGINELTITVPSQDTTHSQEDTEPPHEQADDVQASEELESEEENDNPQLPQARKILKPTKMVWRKSKIGNIPSNFIGDTTLTNSVKDLQTPYQYFKYFFDDDLLQKIVEETIRYSVFKDASKPFEFAVNDLRKYLGICILTSVASLSNTRMYWNSTIGLDIIQRTMSLKTFERIRSNLHFNDNMISPQNDKLHKLRPVIDSLSKKFISIPMEEMLSLDEQICATKARHHLKQYLPLKPHKWGYKLFILSGVSGFCYKFEIYSGSENNASNRLVNEPDLGASSNVVIRLSRDIPRNCHHKLFFDNYYTSVPLVSYLANQGIHSLGTARRNRIPNCKIPTEKEAAKLPRGTSGEFVTNFEGTDISNTFWKDNKMVVLLSSFIGVDPESNVGRYDRKNKEKISIPCPAVVKQYNRHMGGVDLLDSIIGRYKISMRSKKWYMRLFYHLLDISIINAWLLYRRNNAGAQNLMKLADFRIDLAKTLCCIGESSGPKRGRPSSIQQNIDAKRRKPNASALPPTDVRLDNRSHFPNWNETRLRCKLPGCKAQTYVVCQKCDTALCLNKDKNCYKLFHTQ